MPMPVPDKNYFRQNFELLEKYHPGLSELVRKSQDRIFEAEIVVGTNGKMNLQAAIPDQGSPLLIHDPENPGAEAGLFLSMVPENATGVILMFGMGLGYSVVELLKQRQKIQYLVVFELNISFFLQAMTHLDLAEFLSDSRLILCLEIPEDLPRVMAPVHRALMLEDVHTLNLTTCSRVNGQYGELAPRVADYISAFNADGNTKLAFGRTFIENRLKHLTSMHQNRKLEELTGQFKGVPALIVAAGPSLDKNIEQIKTARGRAVIICVDSALPALLAKKIVPDFVTSIDYQELTWEKIAGGAAEPESRNINLICTTWVTDLVPKQFPAKEVFWAYSRNTLENWINGIMGGRISIGGAGTVAHLNFVSANLMGCDPIIFVGQDLAFSDRKGHSANVVLTSDQQVSHQLETGQDIFNVKGAVVPVVPTNRQMHGYRLTFEKMIRESGNKVINATEGGAFIEGAEHMPLADAISANCRQGVSIEIGPPERRFDPQSSLESVLIDINKAVRVIKKAEKLSEPVKKKIQLLEKPQGRVRSFSQLPEALRKKISDLDACHDRLDSMPLFSLFDEITMEGLRQNEREKKAIENIEGNPDRYLEWVRRSLARVDRINDIRMENLSWLKKKIQTIIEYHEKEKECFQYLERDDSRRSTILRLADLYYSDGNLVQIEKLFLNQKKQDIPTSAYAFYQGVTHLVRNRFEPAEKCFQSALGKDASIAQKIEDKRFEIAEFYFRQVQSLNIRGGGVRNPILDMLLIKGFRIWPAHEGICREIRATIERDIKSEEKQREERGASQAAPGEGNLGPWYDRIITIEGFSQCLGPALVFDLCFLHGKRLMENQAYEKALNAYEEARSVFPGKPDIYVAMADLCFFAEDFEKGVSYLKSAVTIDKEYGVLWENMGDNLIAKEDYATAILAFEQCFMALPRRIEVLRKIGECHARIGNLESAREALMQYKHIKTGNGNPQKK